MSREPGTEIHLILDNYGTHKAPAVRRWFAKYPEYRLHFTPTGASWLDMIEHFFAEITEKPISRGAFRSVQALEKTIHDYLEHRNQNPTPFVWTADSDTILKKVANVCRRINNSGH